MTDPSIIDQIVPFIPAKYRILTPFIPFCVPYITRGWYAFRRTGLIGVYHTILFGTIAPTKVAGQQQSAAPVNVAGGTETSTTPNEKI